MQLLCLGPLRHHPNLPLGRFGQDNRHSLGVFERTEVIEPRCLTHPCRVAVAVPRAIVVVSCLGLLFGSAGGKLSKLSPARCCTTNWPSFTAALSKQGSLLLQLDNEMTWLAAPDGVQINARDPDHEPPKSKSVLPSSSVSMRSSPPRSSAWPKINRQRGHHASSLRSATTHMRHRLSFPQSAFESAKPGTLPSIVSNSWRGDGNDNQLFSWRRRELSQRLYLFEFGKNVFPSRRFSVHVQNQYQVRVTMEVEL